MPDLSLDWTLFVLRLAFIALLYLFLYQLVRVTLKDLAARAESTGMGEAGQAVPRQAGARLIVVKPGATGFEPGAAFVLHSTTVVGRHSDSTLVLDDTSVSAEHAELTVQRGRWWVRDLGSTNGTTLNGAVIPGMAAVDNDDVVQFGRVAFRIQY
jgi:hypothetical protein